MEQRCRISSLTLVPSVLGMQPRTRLALWVGSTRCQLVPSLSSLRIPKSFSTGLVWICSTPACADTWGCQTQMQHLALGLNPSLETPMALLLEFVQVLLDDIPPFWCGNLSTQSSANLLRLHSIPTSVLLMKILNSTGTNMNPSGEVAVTDIHPGFMHNMSSTLCVVCADKRLVKGITVSELVLHVRFYDHSGSY